MPATSAGDRLDQALSSAVGSRSQAQRLIDAGLVTVDGRKRSKRHRLEGGEELCFSMPAQPVFDADPGSSATVDVRYEDDALLVVDKPAGVVVHPGRGHRSGTLAQSLAGRAAGGEEPWRAGIVHRLDRDTSGLLVVAKSDAAHRALKGLLARRELQRRYLALVDGCPPARRGTIDAAIGRDRRLRTRVSLETDVPKDARTHFEIERRLASSTLLKISLETGRTHQIRVHLQSIGHPVCGDPEYGVTGRFGLTRQFLHACELRFPHPLGGEEILISSPLPADLELALARAASE